MGSINDVVEDYVSEDTLDEQLETWMQDIAAYQFREQPAFNPAKSAVVIVDMNKPFVDEGMPLSSQSSRAIVPRMEESVQALRQAGVPIIWSVQGHFSVEHDRGPLLKDWWKKPILEGTSDVEMATGLSVHAEDKIIYKRRYNGFYQTDLELTLRSLGVEQVIITGVLTNVCPFTTAMEAFMAGFTVFYPADLTASLNRDLHVNALRTIAGWAGFVVRSKELVQQL